MTSNTQFPERSHGGFNDRLAVLATELHRLAEELGELPREDGRDIDDSGEDLVAFARILYAVAAHRPPRPPASLPINADQLDLLVHLGRALEELRDVSPELHPAPSRRTPARR